MMAVDFKRKFSLQMFTNILTEESLPTIFSIISPAE